MNKKILTALLFAASTVTTQAQVYLDPQAPLEDRVKDAISRMTTHEKIQVIHAQSKFTSAGVPRLGIRQLNMDDGPSRRSPASPPHGTATSPLSMAMP